MYRYAYILYYWTLLGRGRVPIFPEDFCALLLYGRRDKNCSGPSATVVYVTRIQDDENGFLHDFTSYDNNIVSERTVPKNQIVNRCRNRFRCNNL